MWGEFRRISEYGSHQMIKCVLRHRILPTDSNDCCQYHAAMIAVGHAIMKWDSMPCDLQWTPHLNWQCMRCLSLLPGDAPSCYLCELRWQEIAPGAATMCVNTTFRPTPDENLHRMCSLLLRHWALDDKAGTCCPWHGVVCLAGRMLENLLMEDCDPHWTAWGGWQCEQCWCAFPANFRNCPWCRTTALL